MEDCVTGACATERGVKEEGVKAEVEARSERAVTNFMVDVYWVIISLKTKIMGFSVLWRRFQMGNERSMYGSLVLVFQRPEEEERFVFLPCHGEVGGDRVDGLVDEARLMS